MSGRATARMNAEVQNAHGVFTPGRRGSVSPCFLAYFFWYSGQKVRESQTTHVSSWFEFFVHACRTGAP